MGTYIAIMPTWLQIIIFLQLQGVSFKALKQKFVQNKQRPDSITLESDPQV